MDKKSNISIMIWTPILLGLAIWFIYAQVKDYGDSKYTYGLSTGFDVGYKQAYRKGFQDGRDEGFVSGYEQGFPDAVKKSKVERRDDGSFWVTCDVPPTPSSPYHDYASIPLPDIPTWHPGPDYDYLLDENN